MDTIIKVCEVEKFYGNKDTITKAVNRISFEVEKGEFTAIMGASGSGKTTLLNLLATVDQVTSGHIFYDNMDITTLKEEEVAKFRKENLGFVFQDFNLLDTLTLEENVILAMTLHKKEKTGDPADSSVGDESFRDLGVQKEISLSGFRRAKATLCLCQSTCQSSEADSCG